MASYLAHAVQNNFYREKDYLNTTFSIPVESEAAGFLGFMTLTIDETLRHLHHDVDEIVRIEEPYLYAGGKMGQGQSGWRFQVDGREYHVYPQVAKDEGGR